MTWEEKKICENGKHGKQTRTESERKRENYLSLVLARVPSVTGKKSLAHNLQGKKGREIGREEKKQGTEGERKKNHNFSRVDTPSAKRMTQDVPSFCVFLFCEKSLFFVPPSPRCPSWTTGKVAPLEWWRLPSPYDSLDNFLRQTRQFFPSNFRREKKVSLWKK